MEDYRWNRLKEELSTLTGWVIHLDHCDLEGLEGDGKLAIEVMESETECVSKQRITELVTSLKGQLLHLEHQCIESAVLVIQFPKSFPLDMEEMSEFGCLLESMPFKEGAEVKWGLALREDNVSRMICAFK